jgi:hypothetical protein
MVDMVQALAGARRHSADRSDRVLDERHFQFRGRLSAGAQDEQRRSRQENRQDRRDPTNEETVT